jgi:hypothetical protein
VNASSATAWPAAGLCVLVLRSREQFLANRLMCDRRGRRHRWVLGQVSRFPPNASPLAKVLAERVCWGLTTSKLAEAATQTMRAHSSVRRDPTNFAHHRIGPRSSFALATNRRAMGHPTPTVVSMPKTPLALRLAKGDRFRQAQHSSAAEGCVRSTTILNRCPRLSSPLCFIAVPIGHPRGRSLVGGLSAGQSGAVITESSLGRPRSS